MLDESLFQKDFGNLIEVGYIAVKQGNRGAAEKLFKAAQILKPEHTAPTLGFGYIELNAMNLQPARQHFEKVLAQEPNNSMAKVFLGFCYLLSKIQFNRKKLPSGLQPHEVDALAHKGQKLIEEALKESDDPGVQKLGKSSLELANHVEKYYSSML